VETAQGESFAKSNDVHFFEVSAKTGSNIQTLFRSIATRLQQKYNA
jgi:translation initiation factor IF-2